MPTPLWVASLASAKKSVPIFVIIQSVGIGSGSSSSTSSVSPTIAATTSGHLLVMVVSAFAGSPSVSDSASQTWTAGPTATDLSSQTLALFYKTNSAAISTVTAHQTTGADLSCQFWEISIVGGTGAADVSATSGTAGETASTAATVTAGSSTAQNNEIAIGAINTEGGAYTMSGVTAGWSAKTAIETTSGYSMLFPYNQILTSQVTLTLAGTISTSTRWGAVFQTFEV